MEWIAVVAGLKYSGGMHFRKSFNVSAQCALNLTSSNAWASEIADVARQPLPRGPAYGITAATLFLSTVFQGAYAAFSRREAPTSA